MAPTPPESLRGELSSGQPLLFCLTQQPPSQVGSLLLPPAAGPTAQITAMTVLEASGQLADW